MEAMRKILEAINMEVGGIMDDWSDPRSECREILRLTAQALALSSPHHEAREKDGEIGTPREFAERLAWMTINGKPDLGQWENHIKYRDAALSRLAAPKPEGQTIEAYQRLVNGGPCGLMERPAEEANGCGAVFDWEKCKGCGAYPQMAPAAPEPRPAEEPNHIPDVTQMVPSEPAPAPSEEAMPEAIAAADMINDAIDRARVSGDGAGLYTRILSIVDEALRSQLARKDEGMREAVRDVIDRAITGYDTCHGKKHYAYTIDGEQAYLIDSNQMAALVRAALREPDGRKGE